MTWRLLEGKIYKSDSCSGSDTEVSYDDYEPDHGGEGSSSEENNTVGSGE